MTLIAEATVGANVSNPFSVTVTFRPVGQLQILMVRVQSAAVSAPTRQQYFTALNQLPLVYPIPTDPAVAIQFQIVDGSETVTVGVNQLSTQSGMEDLLDTLEDIQEYSDDDNKKIYALVPGGPSSGISMARFGISRPGDNVAFGWSFIMESVGHELGHVYGLAHAPCGIPSPADPDPNFVPAGGIVGEVGVDPVALSAFPTTSADLMSYCGDRGATNSLISTDGDRERRFVPPAAIENAISVIQKKEVRELKSEDALCEFFYAIWSSLKQGSWEELWNPTSKLMTKAGLIAMTSFVTDALIAKYDYAGDLDVTDPEKVREQVQLILSFQTPEFWKSDWTMKISDALAVREKTIESLTKIHRNLRADKAWHEDLELVTLT